MINLHLKLSPKTYTFTDYLLKAAEEFTKAANDFEDRRTKINKNKYDLYLVFALSLKVE